MGAMAQIRRSMLELHATLSGFDRASWDAAAVRSTRAELETIRARLVDAAATARPGADAPHADMAALAGALGEHPPDDDTRERWLAYRRTLLPAYIAVAESLREHAVYVPSLRPTNYVRNLWHVTNTSIALAVLLLMPDPRWTIAASACFCFPFWLLEWIRRRRPAFNARIVHAFRLIVHPHEAIRVNSATWFATALFLLALTRSLVICVPALAVLGAGDPIAALIGRRFGRVRLVHGRTLEGSIAFLVAASAAGWLALTLTHGSLGVAATSSIALAAAFGGALAELVSLRMDDNLSVPLAAGASAALVAWLLGVPL